MKVDIWSDVRCPFCYIGKHKFEKALNDFSNKEGVEVHWHSFELDRSLKTDPHANPIEHLAKAKGIGTEQVRQMMGNVVNAATEIDLTMNLDTGIVANSFHAHRLIQFSKTKGLANTVEEHLFKAYFVESKNIDDKETLVQIGITSGLNEEEVREVLSSEQFSQEVKADEVRAQQIGVQGVPFFVFNDKYAISGAQQPEVFLQALEQSWKEFENTEKPTLFAEGSSCDTDGNCD